jgi:hypothetical protein
VNQTKPILIEVSPGELLDRISIAEIRLSRLDDPDKAMKVHAEIRALREVWDDSAIQYSPLGPEVMRLWKELWTCNMTGWTLEDRVRKIESTETELPFNKDAYIGFCSGIHQNNDRRSGLKRAINDLVGSEMFEEKLHGGSK